LGQHVDMMAGWPGGGGYCWVVLHNTTNPSRFRRLVTRYFGSALTLVANPLWDACENSLLILSLKLWW
jgi:hypothetical protein